MSSRLILILLFLSTGIRGQVVSRISTEEINTVFLHKGVDSALVLFSDIPIYRIDTALAIKLARACRIKEEDIRQYLFLTETGKRVHDTMLNTILFEEVIRKRIEANEMRSIKNIDSQILYALAFQNIKSTMLLLKDEFDFWKAKGDSIEKNLTDSSKEFSEEKQTFNRCQNNYFMIAWVLSKFDSTHFSASYVNALGSSTNYLKYDKIKPLNRNNDFGNWDTINLSTSYTEINKMDFLAEPLIVKRIKYFGDFDSNCRNNLTYNDNSGILELYCWKSEREGWSVKYEVRLISPHKLMIRWIQGGIS